MIRTTSLIVSRLIVSVFLSIALLAFASAQGPQPTRRSAEERERGIQLYNQGDLSGAIEVLRSAVKVDPQDGDAWHYLGLALITGDKTEARKAFAKAARIRVSNLTPMLPGPNSARPGSADRYDAAIDSVQRYLELTPKASEDWKVELDNLRFYQSYYGGKANDEGVLSTKEVTAKPQILRKPEPDFSGSRAFGTVVLRAVFEADGSVRHVLVLRKVESTFDQECIDAARRIEFVPAQKDGRPVSVILQLEYNRSRY